VAGTCGFFAINANGMIYEHTATLYPDMLGGRRPSGVSLR